MTDLQLYILVAIPLVGILANTGLFIHLSTRMDSLQRDMKDLFKALAAIETDVALLKDRAGLR